jgi:two-component system cell cycle sensor histidine kinase/response regulator CckA
VVLVIDEHPEICSMLAAVLPHYGIRVLTAQSGLAAVELFRLEHEAITAALLNVGLDGPETLAALRAAGCKIPIAFMTGGGGKYSRDDLLGFGAACVLPKPFLLVELAQKVLELTGTRP